MARNFGGSPKDALCVHTASVLGLGSAHGSKGVLLLQSACCHTASLWHLTPNMGFLLKAASIKIASSCGVVTPADLFGNNLPTCKYRFLTQKGAKEGTENCLCAGFNIYISDFAK